MRKVLKSLLFVGLLLLGILWYVKYVVTDGDAVQLDVEKLAPQDGRVLVIFPHPDDEVSVCGTIALLDNAGIETNYLCLTRGEKGAKEKGQTALNLMKERTQELKNSAAILGIDILVQDTLPDGELSAMNDSIIKDVILREINRFKPETIITYDTNKGLYGHLDHIKTSRNVVQLCEQYSDSSFFSVNSVVSFTLPEKLVEVFLNNSKKFKNRFYKINDLNLPKPEFAVKTFSSRSQVEAVLNNYNKRKIISNLMPHKRWLPKDLYYYIHDREYFYYSWKRN
ncbi:PIG-L family deacetylase [Puteibacter caeruleilacunae]|nr:PIG-L family deacetylase [Puteibacter caeruleilacunae]